MIYKKSCGFVVYKKVQDTCCYLIIRANNGEYGFPKGHMENAESELETAVRELREETNLDVRVIPGFRWQLEYPFPNKPDVMKIAVFFIGECIGEDIICQEAEVAEAMFVSFKRAIELLSFEDTRQVLKEADAFIQNS